MKYSYKFLQVNVSKTIKMEYAHQCLRILISLRINFVQESDYELDHSIFMELMH